MALKDNQEEWTLHTDRLKTNASRARPAALNGRKRHAGSHFLSRLKILVASKPLANKTKEASRT